MSGITIQTSGTMPAAAAESSENVLQPAGNLSIVPESSASQPAKLDYTAPTTRVADNVGGIGAVGTIVAAIGSSGVLTYTVASQAGPTTTGQIDLIVDQLSTISQQGTYVVGLETDDPPDLVASPPGWKGLADKSHAWAFRKLIGFRQRPRAGESGMFGSARRIAGSDSKAAPRKTPRSLAKSRALSIAVAGALAGLGGVAQAAVLTQIDDFAITQVNPNLFVDKLTFNQFDPTVGTLQGIAISWSGVQQAFLGISSPAGGPWQLALNNEVQLSDADTPDLLTNSLSYPLVGNLTPEGIPSELEANSGIFTGQTNEFSTDDALFEGTGTVSLKVTEGEVAATIFQSAPNMQTFGGTSDVADGTVEVDYIYTGASAAPKPIPEPAGAALFGIALLGLGIARGILLHRSGSRRTFALPGIAKLIEIGMCSCMRIGNAVFHEV